MGRPELNTDLNRCEFYSLPPTETRGKFYRASFDGNQTLRVAVNFIKEKPFCNRATKPLLLACPPKLLFQPITEAHKRLLQLLHIVTAISHSNVQKKIPGCGTQLRCIYSTHGSFLAILFGKYSTTFFACGRQKKRKAAGVSGLVETSIS